MLSLTIAAIVWFALGDSPAELGAVQPLPISSLGAELHRSEPHQDSEKKTETFSMPFLHDVKAPARREVVRFRSSAGERHGIDLKTYYSEAGFPIRAEGGTGGKPVENTPVEELEELWKDSHMLVSGFPQTAPKVSLSALLRILDEEVCYVRDVEWMEISYVMYRRTEDWELKPFYLCSIWAAPSFMKSDIGKSGYVFISFDIETGLYGSSNYH